MPFQTAATVFSSPGAPSTITNSDRHRPRLMRSSRTVRRAGALPKQCRCRAAEVTEAERHAAAMADPDARPTTDAEWARAPHVPQVSIIRRALKLSQEQFATTFHIPIGTIRDWEQGRYEPDAAAHAYLRVIAREPNTLRRALAARKVPSLGDRDADDLSRQLQWPPKSSRSNISS